MKSDFKLVGSVALGLALAALAMTPVCAADADHDWSDINITFVVWLNEGIEVFNPYINGAQDAAAQQGVTLSVQYGDGDAAKMNNIIETSMANQDDGLIVSIWDDAAFDANVCAAVQAGVNVIVANIDDSQGNDGRDCALAFVGQDFVEAGTFLGERIVELAGITAGDTVFLPVEFPEAVYATKRAAGVRVALEKVGATGEIVGVGADASEALSTMTQYFIGHPDTKAVIGLGLVPTSVVSTAMDEVGISVPAGGFDLSVSAIEAVEAGALAAVSDQQMYSQGHITVTELAQSLKYGLHPSNVSTGGFGLVEKSNIGKAREWVSKTR